MSRWLSGTLAVLGLFACSGPATTPPDDTADPSELPAHCLQDDAPTWDNFAQGYVQTWCTPCHTSSLQGADRQGAPPGLDFDRWSQVAAAADRVEVRATGAEPDMPPLGGTDPADVALLERWLECGAPGSDPEPGPCDTLSFAPSTSLASTSEVEALCATHNAVLGLEVSGQVEIDCLCVVKGDVTVSSGSLVAPALEWIGGDLTITDDTSAVSLPALDVVYGEVRLEDAPSLASVDLSGLRETAGPVTVSGLAVLPALELSELTTVGGPLTVTTSPGLTRVALTRLRTVHGALVLEDLPDLVELADTRAVEEVSGDLVLRQLGAVETLDAFTFLLVERVAGDVWIEDNPVLSSVSGFTVLQQVGSVHVARNPQLVAFDAFDTVQVVSGDVVFQDNPRQEHVFGFVNLATVDGSLVVEGLPALRSLAGFDALTQAGEVRVVAVGAVGFVWLQALHTVAGDVVVSDNPQLERIQGFSDLTLLGGDLQVLGNPVLDALEGFGSLTEVGGAVSVGGNGGLVAIAAPRLAAVGGDLQVFDNPNLRNPIGWSGLRAVGGSLEVVGNATLADVTDLFGLESVGGGFTVRNNPMLPTPMVDAWILAIGVGNIAGPVVNEDNG